MEEFGGSDNDNNNNYNDNYNNNNNNKDGDSDKGKMINHIINEWSKLAQKEYKIRREGDLLGIVQEIKIWSYYQIVYAQTRICSREWDA